MFLIIFMTIIYTPIFIHLGANSTHDTIKYIIVRFRISYDILYDIISYPSFHLKIKKLLDDKAYCFFPRIHLTLQLQI